MLEFILLLQRFLRTQLRLYHFSGTFNICKDEIYIGILTLLSEDRFSAPTSNSTPGQYHARRPWPIIRYIPGTSLNLLYHSFMTMCSFIRECCVSTASPPLFFLRWCFLFLRKLTFTCSRYVCIYILGQLLYSFFRCTHRTFTLSYYSKP